MRRKRLVLFVPVLASLFFATIAGSSDPAISQASKSAVVAALTNPLGLFAARSPGGRGAGALLSTKPERTAALVQAPGEPEERVLSEVRDHEPPNGELPAAEDAPLPDYIMGGVPQAAGVEGGLPDDGAPSGGYGIGAPDSGVPYDDSDNPQYIGALPPPGGGSVSAVPEPRIWVMMIAGFLAAGMALRRHGRRRARPTSAP